MVHVHALHSTTLVEELPTYEDTIARQQPPHYCTVASTSDYCPLKMLYTTDPLNLVHIGKAAYIDPTTLSFADYNVQRVDEITHSFLALRILMDDKVTQIEKNIEFMLKKVRTRSRNYYIDLLRSTTCDDFSRIKLRIQREKTELHQLYLLIVHHNDLYCQVDSQISDLQPTSSAYHGKLILKAQVVRNLELLQQRVGEFASTDDVSYVLKERARVYNDAKEVVRRQGQS